MSESVVRIFAGGAAGLDEAQLAAFESALGAELPEEARAMYRRCGGIGTRVRTSLPMRPMPPADALDTLQLLTDAADTYRPHPEARYLFTDDNSNWGGLFVFGPLRGKLTILDHDVSSGAPRFASLESFLAKLAAAADAGRDWPTMQTDYPLAPDADAALVDEARPLCALYLEQHHRASDPMARNLAGEIALHLADPRAGDTVREMLASPWPYVRHVAFQVAAVHKRPEWAPQLAAYAGAALERGEYGPWVSAITALAAIEDGAEVAALVAAAPRNWPRPLRRRDGA